jgi:DNA-binding transcriptional MerR regulator
MSKRKLLSIGEISKLTGASLRSIRYYEKIKLLTPAYIDPDTGYRYYTFEQSYHIEIIMFCVELDIPLKELPTFIDIGETIDYRAFLAYGKKIANEKITGLRNGLKLISSIEKQMELTDTYEVGQIYKREVSEKYYECRPCKPPLDEIDNYDLIMSFFDISLPEISKNEMMEYGFLCERTPLKTSYYAFVEVPKRFANKNTKNIPASTFLCRQDEKSQIEKISVVFNNYLNSNDSYLAIETEIFTSTSKISKPLNELRIAVIA